MQLVVVPLVLALGVVEMVQAQSGPQLTFHFVGPSTDPDSETLDVHIEEELDHLLNGLICRWSGNRFTVRISPETASTDLIDDSFAYTNTTEGSVDCMLSHPTSPVTCVDPAFCSLGNNCRAKIRAMCPLYKSSSRWIMTQAVDVTLEQVDGEVVVTRCFTMCGPLVGAVSVPDKGPAISYLTVCLIVAGVIIAAVILVASLVFWKIKDHSNWIKLEKKRQSFVVFAE
ncbi:uncharacterized protein LOC131954162 [Physella acuta]|uniref:uncharacterized protein LOC131954162 n=1 Tax=Physella acuta TaxID=109671 RepID=UPI0027DD16DD|nr:uncharacterized protein LOC131954162 [Physella acuta]